MKRERDQHPRVRHNGRMTAAESVQQSIKLANSELDLGMAATDPAMARTRIHNARRFLGEAIEKLRRLM